MGQYILSLRFRLNGTTQIEEYATLEGAVRGGQSFYEAFPNGRAQITDRASHALVMTDEALRSAALQPPTPVVAIASPEADLPARSSFARLADLVRRRSHLCPAADLSPAGPKKQGP
jgi:hypothetical protein